MTPFLKKILLTGAFSMSLLSLSQVATAEEKFSTYEPPIATDSADGHIQVLEFFAYNCPHCAQSQPFVDKFLKQKDDKVDFTSVPVSWNVNMEDMQRLYYTLVVLDRLDLHDKAFKAIHEEHKKLFKRDDIIDWLAQQGVDKAKAESVFDSFGVSTKIKQAREITDRYKIDATPTIVVDGKYATSPAMAGGYAQMLEEVQALVQKAQDQ
ncbi:thiol:disulfide interchange protein DsbA/DsbL [Brackiella oedipodis]|uniref:thiol:disulfide interchange protein DsbA/DsbL n=1 Tax=Brackiella oedipodis TaxID=124225 RepID=UPI00056E24B4|nr:thiol:disulfide interchange protein DsbA/DsbL [Brackiella oedipodis]